MRPIYAEIIGKKKLKYIYGMGGRAKIIKKDWPLVLANLDQHILAYIQCKFDSYLY